MSQPPAPAKLESIEALRGIAALLVLVHHACGTIQLPRNYGVTLFGDFFSTGQCGVDIFFVLSGFIIAFTNPRDHVDGRGVLKYALRRLTRIYPVYWAVFVLHTPLMFAFPESGPDTLERSARTVCSSFFLTPWQHHPFLGPAWTLRFEVMFYVLFVPFLVRRWLGWLLWAGLALTAVCLHATGTLPVRNPSSPGSASVWLDQLLSLRILEFLMGVIVCVIVRKRPAAAGIPWMAGGCAGLLGMALVELRFGREAIPAWFLIYAAAGAVMLYGLASRSLTSDVGVAGSRAGVPRWLMILGAASYSIYLVHRPVQQILAKLAVKMTGSAPGFSAVLTVAAALVLVSLAAGILFSKAVEQPLLRFFRRRIAKL